MPFAHLALGIAVMAAWGFNFVVMRWGIDLLPPLVVTTLRFACAALPALLFVRRPVSSWKTLTAYAMFAFAIQFGLLFVALATGMPAGLASLVMQLQAFVTMSLVMLVSGEQPRAHQFAGALLAGAGIAWVGFHLQASAVLLPFLMTVAAACSWGVANIVARSMGRIDMLAMVVWASAMAVPPLFATSVAVHGWAPWNTAFRLLSEGNATLWGVLLFNGYATTILGFGAWAWLLNRHPAGLVAPLTLLVPVFGMLSAAWLLDEPMPGWKLVGAALVLAGLAFNQLGGNWRRLVRSPGKEA